MSTTPLILPCPHCEDGTRWVSRYGGNDPDVWATQCPECDGAGQDTIQCYYNSCTALATQALQFPNPRSPDVTEYYCPAHALEVAAEASPDTSC